jgi:hypothetical protein
MPPPQNEALRQDTTKKQEECLSRDKATRICNYWLKINYNGSARANSQSLGFFVDSWLSLIIHSENSSVKDPYKNLLPVSGC